MVKNPISEIFTSIFTVCALFCTSLMADAGEVDDAFLGTWILRESAGVALKTDGYQWVFDEDKKFTLVTLVGIDKGEWHLDDDSMTFKLIDEDGDEYTQVYKIVSSDNKKIIASQYSVEYIFERSSPKALVNDVDNVGEVSSLHKLTSKSGCYSLSYDSSTWARSIDDEDEELEFFLFCEELGASAMMIYDNISYSAETYKELFLIGLGDEFEDVSLAGESEVTVNGVPMLSLRIKAITEGTVYFFRVYITSGDCGTIVLNIGGLGLLEGACEKEIENLLGGLVIGDFVNPENEGLAKGKATSLIQLCSDYEDNQLKADNRYLGEVLIIAGVVREIAKDLDGEYYVAIDGDADAEISYVRCYFSRSAMSSVAELSKGDSVSIAGRCDGMLSFCVVLRDCSTLTPGG
jgi:hypothetical protein